MNSERCSNSWNITLMIFLNPINSNAKIYYIVVSFFYPSTITWRYIFIYDKEYTPVLADRFLLFFFIKIFSVRWLCLLFLTNKDEKNRRAQYYKFFCQFFFFTVITLIKKFITKQKRFFFPFQNNLSLNLRWIEWYNKFFGSFNNWFLNFN